MLGQASGRSRKVMLAQQHTHCFQKDAFVLHASRPAVGMSALGCIYRNHYCHTLSQGSCLQSSLLYDGLIAGDPAGDPGFCPAVL